MRLPLRLLQAKEINTSESCSKHWTCSLWISAYLEMSEIALLALRAGTGEESLHGIPEFSRLLLLPDFLSLDAVSSIGRFSGDSKAIPKKGLQDLELKNMLEV